MSRIIVANVGHEAALRQGDPLHYTPPRTVQQIRQSLWCLPLWTHPTALVHPFSPFVSSYLSSEQKARIAVPSSSVSHVELWGQERSLLYTVQRRYGVERGETPEPLPVTLTECLTRRTSQHFFDAYPELLPYPVRMIGRWSDLLSDHTVPLLLKLPYSSSGRGIIPIDLTSPGDNRRTVESLLARYGEILVEPHLDRLADYGVEYLIDDSGQLHLLGICPFVADSRGQYSESLCQAPTKSMEQLRETLSDAGMLDTALVAQQRFISDRIAPHYRGYLGVDMLTYRTASGDVGLHPWVEVNLRYTMGHYALDLTRQCVPHDAARAYRFGICSAARWSRTMPEAPIRSSSGLLLDGTLPLTAPHGVTHVAYLRV